ncbi:protein argonaute [Trifolium repens]|nr:protein argonaute [Trifolium repens]
MTMFYPHLIASMQLGGMNSFLLTESQHSIPLVSNIPTSIIGMDISHGSPGQSDVPSIAAVWHILVEPCYELEIYWPQTSRYRAAVRTQSSKVEMITSLFKDDGIISELLKDFYATYDNELFNYITLIDPSFNQIDVIINKKDGTSIIFHKLVLLFPPPPFTMCCLK